MFTSEYSILECPPLSKPFLMDLTTTTTKWKCTNTEIAPNCPRCASTNTKFCYYNNYSLSQPRYFCKGCRRYWTKGGSLRNVPVGGGCRKSRRARASRQSGSHAGPIPGPGGGGGQGAINEPENATCIDLAAVYAKYVNPNVGNEESRSPGASSGSSDNNNNYYNNNNQGNYLDIDNQIEDVPIFEYQKMLPMDLINRGDDQVQQAVAGFSLQPQMDGQDFVYQDFDGFEMQQQGMIGDEMGVDVLWSEEGTSLPNLGSQVQPVMQQVQDFGLFSPDDQFRISANLVPDHWSSFDLSGYELFSNP